MLPKYKVIVSCMISPTLTSVRIQNSAIEYSKTSEINGMLSQIQKVIRQ